MSVQGIMEWTVDIDKPAKPVHLGPIFEGDQDEFKVSLHLMQNGQPVSLTGATVTAYMRRADRTTVVWSGSVSSNIASVVLTQHVHTIPGRAQLVVRVTIGTTKHTVFSAEGDVLRTTTDAIVDPTGVIPSLDDLLAQIERMEQATAAAEEVAENVEGMISAAVDPVATDVSELKGVVASLNESVGNLARLDYEWIDGFYVSNAGTIVNNDSYSWTGYVELSDYIKMPIAYSLRAFKNTGIAFFDQYKNLLLVQQISESDSLEFVSGVIDNYGDAKFVAACTPIDNKSKSVLMYTNINNATIQITDIPNGIVTEQKMSNSLVSHDDRTNYIDYSKISAGRYINSSGNERTSTNVNATDYIPLLENATYYVGNVYRSYYAFYDENKTLVASYGTLGDINGSFTVPPGAMYGRFTINDTPYANQDAWIYTSNSKPATYGTIWNVNTKIADNAVTESKIADNAVTESKASFIVHDPSTNGITGWSDNCLIRGDGTVRTNVSGFAASDPIYLVPGESYMSSDNIYHSGYCCFYDKDGNVVIGYDFNEPWSKNFVPPDQAAYMRVTVTSLDYKDSAWVATSANPKPFGYMLKETVAVHNYISNPCDFAGNDITAFTKCICIGDSLTAGTMNHNDSGQNEFISYDKYSFPRNLERITGIQVTNLGHGGASSAEWYEMEKNADLSGYDIAIIQLGVNDQIRYSSMGETSKTAFRNIIAKLKRENKNIKIFVANIIPARSYANAGYLAFSAALLEWLETEYATDKDVIPLDIQRYGHTKEQAAYNCGHLSAYGYNRLARDYIAYISWYMVQNPDVFKEIQFIGTDYWYENPNA